MGGKLASTLLRRLNHDPTLWIRPPALAPLLPVFQHLCRCDYDRCDYSVLVYLQEGRLQPIFGTADVSAARQPHHVVLSRLRPLECCSRGASLPGAPASLSATGMI